MRYEGCGEKGQMSHTYFCSVWTILQSLEFSCFVLTCCAFLHTSLHSVETGSVAAVSASSEGLSQDVSLMCLYLVGKAGALMLAWWKITFPAFPDYLSVLCQLLVNVAGVCSGRLNVLISTWERILASCKLWVKAGALFEGFPSCSKHSEVKVWGLVRDNCLN